MPPKGRYTNLEAELAHDVGVVEERLDNVVETQGEHGRLLNGIMLKLDRKTEACARSHAEFMVRDVEPRILGATSPVEMIRRWVANPLVWAVILMVGLICKGAGDWVQCAYITAHDNKARVTIIENSIRGIPEQMKRQNDTINKILIQVKKVDER